MVLIAYSIIAALFVYGLIELKMWLENNDQ